MTKKNNSLKNIVVLLASLFISLSSFSQKNKTNQVDEIAKQMFIDMNNRDFDAVVEMTYPKVFDFVTKEQMKTFIKSMFEGNNEFSIEIPEITPKYKLSKVFEGKQNNLEYAFVSYDMNMNMTFHNQEFDDNGKKMMTSVMKAKGMNVNFISNNSMDVFMKDRLTIILKNDLTQDKWKMLNYDPDSPLFYQMTPSVLIEAGKEYKQDLMLESKKEMESQNTQKN